MHQYPLLTSRSKLYSGMFYAHEPRKEFSGLRWTRLGAADRGEEHSAYPIRCGLRRSDSCSAVSRIVRQLQDAVRI